MVKTQAEIQREYRARKKLQGSEFLSKERERAKQYRKPMRDCSKKDTIMKRQRNRLYGQRFRDKQNIKKNPTVTVEIDESEQSPTISSSTTLVSDITEEPCSLRSNRSPLLVKLSFPGKKRVSNSSLTRAKREIKCLNQRIADLKRNKAKWKKRCQRSEKHVVNKKTPGAGQSQQEAGFEPEVVEAMTPKTRTKLDLKSARLTPRSGRNVKRKLLLANALMSEIKDSKDGNKEQRRKHVLAKIVSGRITKKYRCLAQISRDTGISRRTLSKAQGKSIMCTNRRQRLPKAREQLKSKVVSFMERDDVSTMLPGKNDATKQGKTKVQTRVFTDYLANIYAKFVAEHPGAKLSFSLFCRWRPSYIKLTKCISRNICLCTRHENMSLKLKCLRALGLKVPQSSESASKSITLQDMERLLDAVTDENIEYDQWKRVEVEGKKKMKVVKVTSSNADFVKTMISDYADFLQHVDRIKDQYSALRDLKSNLPPNHLIVQMDFAENFTCKSVNEIQSAYWNATSVTLHPVVVHFKSEQGQDDHKNFVYVSDVSHHNATAVMTIIDKLMADITKMFPNATTVHYWTDSPSSQYRNRFIFDAVLHHADLYGIHARWNYWECGHGKGACDGLGGTAKRQAADAVKQGKANIQDAHDFFKWAADNQKSINYRYYSQVDYDKMASVVATSNAKTIPGTMKTHAVYPAKDTLYTRNTSCYCQMCLYGDTICKSWKPHQMVQTPNNPEEMDIDDKSREESVALRSGQFVAATYDESWYVGKVMDCDDTDETVHITFMERTKGKSAVPTFKWPNVHDELWMNLGDIICTIDTPLPTGKTCRQFKLSNTDLDTIMSHIK